MKRCTKIDRVSVRVIIIIIIIIIIEIVHEVQV